MPGRGGAAGRTGCDGSGRGPPIGVPGRGGRAPPGRGAAGRAPVPGAAGRGAAGRLRFPVGACDADDGVCTGGRTSIGRRGGAGGACPVRGSSTRKRMVGGTTRPVGAGTGGRGGVAGAALAAAAAAAGGSGAGGGEVSAATTGSSRTGGAKGDGGGSGTASTTSGSITGSGSGSTTGGGGTGGGTSTASGAAGGATTTSAGGFADFTRRGGGSDGAAGLAGSGALPAGFFPFTAAGTSANDAFEGTLSPRCRAMRDTNSRATTSSIVLDALFTSMP
jgi:hypothetical protein